MCNMGIIIHLVKLNHTTNLSPSFIHFSSDSLLLIFESFTAHHLSKNNWLRGIIFILLVRWGFSFLMVLVCLGKSYLCVTILSNLIYLAFWELMSLRVGCLTACSRGSHQICSLRLLPHNLLSFASLGTKINKSKSVAFAVQSNYNS